MLGPLLKYMKYIDSVFGLESGKKKGYAARNTFATALVQIVYPVILDMKKSSSRLSKHTKPLEKFGFSISRAISSSSAAANGRKVTTLMLKRVNEVNHRVRGRGTVLRTRITKRTSQLLE